MVVIRGRGRVGRSPTRTGSLAKSLKIGILTLRWSRCAVYRWRAICNVHVAQSELRTDMVRRVAAAAALSYTGKLSTSGHDECRLCICKIQRESPCCQHPELRECVNGKRHTSDHSFVGIKYFYASIFFT